MLTRMVWPLIEARSFERAITRISLLLRASMPNGGADQPASICLDMTAVNVGAGPPVATGLASTFASAMSASTLACVDEPFVEYAIVRPAMSAIDLIGESARTYQKASSPVACALMMRTGAPLEKAP